MESRESQDFFLSRVTAATIRVVLLGGWIAWCLGVPTLVIVIGAIGGMISSGIIGLFVGAVVWAVGYELFVAWVKGNDEPQPMAGKSARPSPWMLRVRGARPHRRYHSNQ